MDRPFPILIIVAAVLTPNFVKRQYVNKLTVQNMAGIMLCGFFLIIMKLISDI